MHDAVHTFPRPRADRDRLARRDRGAADSSGSQWSLRHAYDNVPAYRKKFDAAGVHSRRFQALDDLANFPFTTKEDLRDNYPFGMFAVPQDKIVRIHASSGTTGKPTVVGYTQRRHRHLGRSDGALDPRRPAGGPA